MCVKCSCILNVGKTKTWFWHFLVSPQLKLLLPFWKKNPLSWFPWLESWLLMFALVWPPVFACATGELFLAFKSLCSSTTWANVEAFTSSLFLWIHHLLNSTFLAQFLEMWPLSLEKISRRFISIFALSAHQKKTSTCRQIALQNSIKKNVIWSRQNAINHRCFHCTKKLICIVANNTFYRCVGC